MLGFFVIPISEHSFMMKALSKLYLVRTEQPKIFNQKKIKRDIKKNRFKNLKNETPEEFKDTPVENEV